jgi:hypothetical protein
MLVGRAASPARHGSWLATGRYAAGRHAASPLLGVACFAVLALCCGCTPAGVMAYKFAGEQTIPAQYVPAKEPMVVFVQRSQNPSDAQYDAERIAHSVTDELKAHKVAPMIDPSAVAALQPRRVGTSVWAAARGAGPGPAAMGVEQVGHAVGARQVLYVDLVAFHIDSALATEMFKGEAEAHVWVIDVQSGRARWPTDTTQGYAVTVSAPYAQPGEKMDEMRMREQMARDLAGRIAKLFYAWKAEDVNETPASPPGTPGSPVN